MADVNVPAGKYMIDSYLDWSKKEGIPILEDFGLDLLAVKTAPWARLGVNGAIVHVKGRGDCMTVFLVDIPPGGQTLPQKHIFEAAFYVLSGSGTSVVEKYSGERHQFEWSTSSVFAPPLNTRYQLFNTSGREPARIAMSCNLPAVLNLFHNEQFVFDNPAIFPEREGSQSHFQGEGDFIPVKPGKHMWETNLLPDARRFKLHEWGARGAGASHIQLILADGVLHAHISEMPVGTYKKAHRHAPDVHIYIISGEGYSLLFYEGDTDIKRIDWRPGWVFAPPDMIFHQHFNSGGEPVRYIAFTQGSVRYPLTEHMRRVYAKIDLDVKKGGNQIEYRDQDPRVHRMFVDELARKGLTVKMPELENVVGA
jgi:oxalate decarboxylase/phosphoglucose isomerase-like protein (cupin superfamily)